MPVRCYTASPSLPQPVIIAYHLSIRAAPWKRAGEARWNGSRDSYIRADGKYTRFCYKVVPLSFVFFLTAIFSLTLKGASSDPREDKKDLKEMIGLSVRGSLDGFWSVFSFDTQ